MSASLMVSCVGVATHPGLGPIAQETASASPTLCAEYGPDEWMDVSMDEHIVMVLRNSQNIIKVHQCRYAGKYLL